VTPFIVDHFFGFFDNSGLLFTIIVLLPKRIFKQISNLPFSGQRVSPISPLRAKTTSEQVSLMNDERAANVGMHSILPPSSADKK
jgi:hypothetical protein